MFDAIARRIFGSANDRYVSGLGPIVDKISALESTVQNLTDRSDTYSCRLFFLREIKHFLRIVTSCAFVT